MQNKGTVVLWVMMSLLTPYCLLLGQEGRKPADRQIEIGKRQHRPPDPTATWTEQQLIESLDKAVSERQIEFLGSRLYWYAEKGVSLKSEKIAQKILDIPEFDSGVTQSKIRALTLFKDYAGVRDYVIKSLNIQSRPIQATAARTLLSWGEWDLAAPVICNIEAYIVFQTIKDERAVPLLEEAVKNGSWQGRIYAASALFSTYGDSTKLPQVALDIILNAPINTDDEDINRARYIALGEVPRFNLLEALPGIIRNARDDDFGISSQAVGHLLHFSVLGYQEATQVLMDIRDHHSNASIREQAKHGLLKLEQEQK